MYYWTAARMGIRLQCVTCPDARFAWSLGMPCRARSAEPLITRSVRSVVWEGRPARGVPIPMEMPIDHFET